jgi:hypothetical protein
VEENGAADREGDWDARAAGLRRRAAELHDAGATVDEVSDALGILPEDVRVLLGLPPVERDGVDGWVLEFRSDEP